MRKPLCSPSFSFISIRFGSCEVRRLTRALACYATSHNTKLDVWNILFLGWSWWSPQSKIASNGDNQVERIQQRNERKVWLHHRFVTVSTSLGSLRKPRPRRQRERHQTKGLMSKTIAVPFSANRQREMSFASSTERGRRRVIFRFCVWIELRLCIFNLSTYL